MALVSKPYSIPMGPQVGVVIGSGCSNSKLLRFDLQKTTGFSVSSSFGELVTGNGGAAVNVGISSRGLPWRTLSLQSPTVSVAQHSSSTARRCLGTLGQTTLNALVDEEQAHGAEEKEYPYELQEEEELLKRKAALVVQKLAGSCIFLVGMMGSGKTTVGKHVSEALGYFFFDSDKLVEEAAGGTTVAEMFRAGREEEFRNAETEVLQQLSSMVRLVVATGGGAVVRPQNWGYLRHGITVWLDVPVDSLAERVVAVGCHSRPLLGIPPTESAYKQALDRLTRILHERADFYASADTVVSVQDIARLKGQTVNSITPTMIAVQVLEEIHDLLERDQRFNQQ